MAIQPIKFLVSPSATATNGSKTVTVTGNVDCSFVYSGTAVALGTRQVVEAVSGTKPDVSGNSVITLRDNWADPTTTAKLVAFNTIEGLAEAIRRAREVVQASEAALSGNVSYMGDHSAATGNFPAAPGEGLGSQIYRISIAGTISEREYKVGELIYYDQYFTQWRSFFDGFGSAAQRNAGTGTADLPDNALLNERLGTTGNLGNAAIKAVTENPTDTTAGRVLQMGDGGIGRIDSVYSGDANDAPYGTVLLSFTSANNFFNRNSFLTTVLGSPINPYKTQTLYRLDASARATRFFNGTSWSNWALIFTPGTLVGPVSQDAGFPTGAVIERGSNSNGHYVRFADGTQICTNSFSVTLTVNVPTGGLFWSGSSTNLGSFAANFITAPSIATKSFSASSQFIIDGQAPTNSQAGSLFVVSEQSKSTAVYTLTFTAVGRWY